VYSPGRTGSTLIVKNLEKYLSKYETPHLPFDVIHTHDPKFVPPTDDYVCIVSYRESSLDVSCSLYVSDKTGELIQYSGQEIEPFAVDKDEFRKTYFSIKAFYKTIDLSKFNKVIRLWYTPLMTDRTYLFKRLGISVPLSTDYGRSNKSPYDYTHLITNYSELQEYEIELDRKNIGKRFIVYSPGHTGAELLGDLISYYYGADAVHISSDPELVFEKSLDDSLVCILSKRRQVIDVGLQSILDTHSDKNKHFNVDVEEFKAVLNNYSAFFKQVPVTAYPVVKEVYYEDLQSNKKSIIELLGIASEREFVPFTTPVNYCYNIILNSDELVEEAKKLGY
jgi:hypothetical protein